MTTTTDLGAIPQIKTPDIIKKASMKASELMDLGTSPEDRQRVMDYRAAPYLQAQQKMTDQYNKMAEQQGLRFSTERREGLADITTNIGRQLGESVYAPMIEREQENQRANIQLGAQIGGLQTQIDQFAASHGLAKEEFQEKVRQFNQGYDLQNKELEETIRQYNTTLGQTQAEMAQQQTQFEKTFRLQERQTTMAENDSAISRATAWGNMTGTYTDPVTKQDMPTLEAKRQKDDLALQTAIAKGYFEEDGQVTVTDLFSDEEWGVFWKEMTGQDWQGWGSYGVSEDGDTSSASDIAAKAEKVGKDAEEAQRLTNWSEKTAIPVATLGRITAALPDDVEQGIFDKLIKGTLTVGELQGAFSGNLDAFFEMADYLTSEGSTSPGAIVRLIGGGQSTGGGGNQSGGGLKAELEGIGADRLLQEARQRWDGESVNRVADAFNLKLITADQIGATFPGYRADHIINLVAPQRAVQGLY